MAQTTNLIRRNGRFYFNKAFPKALWPVLGKAPFRVSLDTTVLEHAQRRRIDAEKAYWAKVDEARGRAAESEPRALTEDDMDLVRSHFWNGIMRYSKLSLKLDHSPEAHARRLTAHRNRLEDYRRALARGDYLAYRVFANAVLKKAGLTVDPTHPTYFMLCRDLLRLAVGHTESIVAQLEGNYGFQSADPLYRQTDQQAADTHRAAGPSAGTSSTRRG